MLLAGMGLVIVGLGFKVAAVPFHFWAPDVYQGAPTPFAGYMAAVAKAGGFAGLVRVLMVALPTEAADWRPIIWVLATASVLVGSVLALVQADLKRMLAYSSVSQAGYVLIGLQAGTTQGMTRRVLLPFHLHLHGHRHFRRRRRGAGPGRGPQRPGRRPRPGRAQPVAGRRHARAAPGPGRDPSHQRLPGQVGRDIGGHRQGPVRPGLIGMLGAAIAAFFYLRVALLMYMPAAARDTAVAEAGPGPDGEEGAYGASDLSAIASAGLSGRDSALALRAPPAARLRVPGATSVVLAICVAFTIFAGVSTPVLSLAHTIVLPWTP